MRAGWACAAFCQWAMAGLCGGGLFFEHLPAAGLRNVAGSARRVTQWWAGGVWSASSCRQGPTVFGTTAPVWDAQGAVRLPTAAARPAWKGDVRMSSTAPPRPRASRFRHRLTALTGSFALAVTGLVALAAGPAAAAPPTVIATVNTGSSADTVVVAPDGNTVYVGNASTRAESTLWTPRPTRSPARSPPADPAPSAWR